MVSWRRTPRRGPTVCPSFVTLISKGFAGMVGDNIVLVCFCMCLFSATFLLCIRYSVVGLNASKTSP